MKLTMKLLVLFFGVLMLASVANAESPREQLKRMIEQLQKNPGDEALREKIIKIAQTIKPSPAVPDEAIRNEGRAQYLFGHAKNEQDYLDAAKEYERAVSAAPWVVGYYDDLCTIYEKAGKLTDAKRNCQFTLSGIFNPAQASDIKRRIGGLEIGIERSTPEAIAVRKHEEQNNLLGSFEGAQFSRTDFDKNWNATFKQTIKITNGDILFGVILVEGSAPGFTSGLFVISDRTKLTSRQFSFPKQGTCVDFQKKSFYSCPSHGEISEDGRTIIYDVNIAPSGDERRYIYYRE